MILRYTNVLSEVNYGIVLDTDLPTGMLFVFFDTFTALLERLEQRGKVSDFVRTGLSVRKTWVRAPRVGVHGDKSEVLPINTPVSWSSDELKQAQLLLAKRQNGNSH